MEVKQSNRLQGAMFMVLSAIAFAFMQAMVALSADTIPIFEQLFFRNLVATFIAYIGIRQDKLPMFGKKGNRKLLTLRATTGYLGMIALFYASPRAGQGDVAIVVKTSPFVVSLLALIFLKEKISKYESVALVIAFLGAFFVANPEFNSDPLPLFVAFLSSLCAGSAYFFISALKGREHPKVIIFFFSIFSTLASLPMMLSNLVIPDLKHLILLVSIGVFAAMGQLALTYAYVVAKASEVSVYNYSGIIFSILVGYFLLGQEIAMKSILGAILVIGAGCIAFFGNQKLERDAKSS